MRTQFSRICKRCEGDYETHHRHSKFCSKCNKQKKIKIPTEEEIDRRLEAGIKKMKEEKKAKEEKERKNF